MVTRHRRKRLIQAGAKAVKGGPGPRGPKLELQAGPKGIKGGPGPQGPVLLPMTAETKALWDRINADTVRRDWIENGPIVALIAVLCGYILYQCYGIIKG